MNSNWLVIPKPQPQASTRLICLPYAGGSASTYVRWAELLADDIELIIIRPPGRSTRIKESPCQTMAELIAGLLPAITPLLNKPYFIFGHSFGGRVAYQLLVQLQKNNLPLAEHFFTSASRAPHISGSGRYIHNLPDDELILKLKKINNLNNAVFDDLGFMQLFLPFIRADFKIAETFVTEPTKLLCPITAFAGDEDQVVNLTSIEAWAQVTNEFVGTQMVSGGHLFVESQYQTILDYITQTIQQNKQILAI